MAAHHVDGSLLLKKFGAMILICLGILGIALGLEYRSNGLSPELIGHHCPCHRHGSPRAENHPT